MYDLSSLKDLEIWFFSGLPLHEKVQRAVEFKMEVDCNGLMPPSEYYTLITEESEVHNSEKIFIFSLHKRLSLGFQILSLDGY